MRELPKDRICRELQSSDKPEFQALRRMADLQAARLEADEKGRQFRFEIFREQIQKTGEWEI